MTFFFLNCINLIFYDEQKNGIAVYNTCDDVYVGFMCK